MQPLHASLVIACSTLRHSPCVVSALVLAQLLHCCLSVHHRRTNGRLRCPALSPKMKSRFVLRRQPKATGVRPNLRQVRCSEGRP